MQMEKILELRRKRTLIVEEAREYLDKAEKESRPWGDEDERKFKELTDQIEGVTRAEEREMKLEGYMSTKDIPPTAPNPEDDSPAQKGQFRSFGEFLYTVRTHPEDKRLVRTGLSEGDDSAGGFLVPGEYASAIMMTTLETAVIRGNGATVIPMRSDTLDIPKVVDTSHASSLFGGVVAYRTEEKGTLTPKEPTFGSIKLIATTLTGYTYASNQLLADNAVGLAALLTKMFGGAIGWYEDNDFINGNGVGKPLGILNSGALLAVNRSAASTVAIADLASIISRVLPQSLGRGIWLANSTVLSQLMALGSTYLTWLANGIADLTRPIPATLLGRPIFFTEKCQALGTAGDIVFVDLSFYLIGDRERISIASSEHVRFTTNETAWRFLERNDGQPWVDSAFTPANGSTLSPFVTLYSATTGGD
ncbi:MAG TPA: phage major capsid protein [Dehalococcoidales bacterium]|nr:phage major capsid protein [Dehalococcoidales bacterium]